MSGRPEFRVEVYQNEYLPAGARQVNAILTVTAGPPSEPSTQGSWMRG